MSIAEMIEVTAEEFLARPDRKSFELINGVLEERSVSVLPSIIEMKLGGRLNAYVESNGLGWVLSSGNGYQCFPNSPNTVRKPDLSFIRSERLGIEEIGEGWVKIRPDLAVEVVSPHDLSYEVEEKVEEYRRVGVPLVWVVLPPTRLIRVHRLDGFVTFVRAEGELSGEDVVPGFACRVADIFPPGMASIR